MSSTELSAGFFLALVVILLTCRAVSWALRFIGQPPVVGEMVAGVVLGPSLLGLLAPGVADTVFPADLQPVLFVVGQIGLVAFMFQTGYEFRTDRVTTVARSAAGISIAGIIAPFAMGIGLAYLVAGLPDIFSDDVPMLVSALFLAVALAITAFPMLARIITERGLTDTRFGAISLASGALDDAVAWVLLAGVLSIASATAGPIGIAFGGSVLLLAVLAVLVRNRKRAGDRISRLAPEHRFLVLLIALFIAAWFTDFIGLYAVFGAFSLGVALPRTPALTKAVNSLRPVSTVFLPLFFTYSGLHTDFGLLVTPTLLLFAAGCVAVAIIGKFGACWLAARMSGETPAVALRVGTLMNARGLMQLIAINIGLSAGITTPALFSVLVVVALVTTIMATPMLSLWDRLDRRRRARPEPATADVG